MSNTATELRTKLAAITHRCWNDEQFANRLCEDPTGVCDEYGISLRDGVKVSFHIDTSGEKNFSIPMKPEIQVAGNVTKTEEHLLSLSRLHAEVACTTNWVQGDIS